MRVFVTRLCNGMSAIAGVVLLAMTAITLADVIMRLFGRPVPGTYEVVAFMGVAVTGFALPRASLKKTHVYVDILVDKLSGTPHKVLRVITRVLVCAMFLVTAWYFILMGKSFVDTRSVTMTLRLPFYPVVFGMTLSCIAQCLVSIYEMFEEFEDEGGGNNE
jgi:TRAP-type C4-dicarboxylate transport system permease small subunit